MARRTKPPVGAALVPVLLLLTAAVAAAEPVVHTLIATECQRYFSWCVSCVPAQPLLCHLSAACRQSPPPRACLLPAHLTAAQTPSAAQAKHRCVCGSDALLAGAAAAAARAVYILSAPRGGRVALAGGRAGASTLPSAKRYPCSCPSPAPALCRHGVQLPQGGAAGHADAPPVVLRRGVSAAETGGQNRPSSSQNRRRQPEPPARPAARCPLPFNPRLKPRKRPPTCSFLASHPRCPTCRWAELPEPDKALSDDIPTHRCPSYSHHPRTADCEWRRGALRAGWGQAGRGAVLLWGSTSE